MTLQPARFPEREMFTLAAVTGEEMRILAEWVRGVPFHPYGMRPHELERFDVECPGMLDVRGAMNAFGGGMSWSIAWQRSGDPSGGLVGGSGTVEYAAYRALALIEAAEREEWEERLVAGLA